MADQGSARRWRRIADILFDRAPRVIIASFVLVGIAINFANVVGRYLFKTPIFWAEEILVFIVVWSVAVGIVAVAYNGAHLKMDLLASGLSRRLKMMINSLIVLCLAAFGTFVIVQSARVVWLLIRNSQVSVTAGVPMFIPHSALLIGFLFMVLAVVARIRAYLTGDFGDS